MQNENEKKASVNREENAAAFYDRFLGPLFFEPYAIEVANSIDPAGIETVLELAAGTGRVTRHLKNRLPAARLTASDISDQMLAEAKKNVNRLDIEFEKIDGQALPFAENSVDLIVCCFGYMFMPDKIKAFREANRILKPGGMLLFSTWDKLEYNELSFVSRKLAESYQDTPFPPSFDLAVSMNDADAISSMLNDAGFTAIEIETVTRFSVCTSAREAANGQVDGSGVFAGIREKQPENIALIKDELEKQLAERFGASPMIAPLRALITRASKTMESQVNP